MIRTQFVALGGLALAVIGSAALGVTAGGQARSIRVNPDDVHFTTVPSPKNEPGVDEDPASAASSRPSPVPESPAWTISPDSFGPVTTDMIRGQVLATGAFRERPDRCPYKLPWHTQKFEQLEDADAVSAVEPYFSSIEFSIEDVGKIQHIDPGSAVRTDTGIGVGDTVKQLRAAYEDEHIFYSDPTESNDSEAYYGINGKRSHLIFYVVDGIVEGITLDPGLIDAEHPVSGEGRGIAVCP